MIKLLGTLDILTAAVFWMSVIFPIPNMILWIFGLYLILKGFAFILAGFDLFSVLDIICGIIFIISILFNMVPLVISIACMFLIIKGILSLIS